MVSSLYGNHKSRSYDEKLVEVALVECITQKGMFYGFTEKKTDIGSLQMPLHDIATSLDESGLYKMDFDHIFSPQFSMNISVRVRRITDCPKKYWSTLIRGTDINQISCSNPTPTETMSDVTVTVHFMSFKCDNLNEFESCMGSDLAYHVDKKEHLLHSVDIADIDVYEEHWNFVQLTMTGDSIKRQRLARTFLDKKLNNEYDMKRYIKSMAVLHYLVNEFNMLHQDCNELQIDFRMPKFYHIRNNKSRENWYFIVDVLEDPKLSFERIFGSIDVTLSEEWLDIKTRLLTFCTWCYRVTSGLIIPNLLFSSKCNFNSPLPMLFSNIGTTSTVFCNDQFVSKECLENILLDASAWLSKVRHDIEANNVMKYSAGDNGYITIGVSELNGITAKLQAIKSPEDESMFETINQPIVSLQISKRPYYVSPDEVFRKALVHVKDTDGYRAYRLREMLNPGDDCEMYHTMLRKHALIRTLAATYQSQHTGLGMEHCIPALYSLQLTIQPHHVKNRYYLLEPDIPTTNVRNWITHLKIEANVPNEVLSFSRWVYYVSGNTVALADISGKFNDSRFLYTNCQLVSSRSTKLFKRLKAKEIKTFGQALIDHIYQEILTRFEQQIAIHRTIGIKLRPRRPTSLYRIANAPKSLTDLEQLKQQDSIQMELDSVTYEVEIDANPFSKGSMRVAYHGVLYGHGKVPRKLILKQFIHPEYNKKRQYALVAQSHSIARCLTSLYANKLKKKLDIDFVNVDILEVDSEFYSIEDVLDGEFTKWTSNVGIVDIKVPHCLLEFSVWTYKATNGYLMVADLQGVSNGSSFNLTDPAILCVQPNRFGHCGLDEVNMKQLNTTCEVHLLTVSFVRLLLYSQ